MLLQLFKTKIHLFINKIKYNNNFIFRLNKNLSTAPIIDNAIGIVFFYAKNFFLSITIRPKFSNQINYEKYIYKKNKFGLIIQGPINENLKFLIETLKIYKKIFKNVHVVVSTWEDERKYSHYIKPYCDFILFNKKPSISGPANINLQTTSVYNALNYLKKKRIKYSLKSRTDCRIHNPRSFLFLYNLLNTFPIKISFKKKVKNRILASSSYSCKYKLYGITDILLFSTTEQLLKYFTKEYFNIDIKSIGVQNKSLIKKKTFAVAESYLCASYVNRVGLKLEWTFKNWEKILKEIFCIFDASSLDFYWDKYEKTFEQRRSINYSFFDNRKISFSDWLNIYHSKNDMINPKFQEKWKVYKKKIIKYSYF